MTAETRKPRRRRRTIERPREPGAPFTVRQAAGALNMAERTVRALCQSGRLRSYREGPRGGLVRIRESDLLAYIEERMGQGVTPEADPKLTFRRHLKPAARSRPRA